MTATPNGRTLRIALAGSLAVHLIVAAIIYSRPVTAAPEQRAHQLHIVRLILPSPPPPRPTPPPRKPVMPQAHLQRHAAHPRIHRVVLTNPHSDGPPIAPPVETTEGPYPISDGTPQPAATDAAISATPTPKPACSAPDVPAKALVADSPVVSDDERNGFTGTAKVKVDLDAAGKVVGASIYESTGSVPLDQAAIAAARASRYAPEALDCKNVAGSYLFTIDFQ